MSKTLGAILTVVAAIAVNVIPRPDGIADDRSLAQEPPSPRRSFLRRLFG